MKQIAELIEKIKERKPKRILLQLPEGLKTRAIEIVSKIEDAGIEVILSADSCYGACDLRINEAFLTKSDLIVHVGHSELYKKINSEIPVLYFPWKIDAKLNRNKIGKQLAGIKEERIGLLTTVQYLGQLDAFFDALASIGKKPVIGGEVLGCYSESAGKIKSKVDCFLFIGTGRFHPLGLAGLHKRIYFYDLEKGMLHDMSRDLIIEEKKRAARIEKARDAKSFAILVSSKPGQNNLDAAESMKKALKERNKKAFIVIMDEIRGDRLLGLSVDCFINTACPRLCEDKSPKLMINIDEMNEVLK